MRRFISSDAIGWRLLRFTTVVVIGLVATRALAAMLGRHCTQSLDHALTFGAPIGFSLGAATLSHARHRRWQRTMAIALAVFTGSLLACSVAVSNLFGAIDRGKQKYTMAEMQKIASAIEQGRSVEGRVDGWGTPYSIRASATGYVIVSFGDCGLPDIPAGTAYPSGTTSSYGDDIVFADGHFTRYPMGTQQ